MRTFLRYLIHKYFEKNAWAGLQGMRHAHGAGPAPSGRVSEVTQKGALARLQKGARARTAQSGSAHSLRPAGRTSPARQSAQASPGRAHKPRPVRRTSPARQGAQAPPVRRTSPARPSPERRAGLGPEECAGPAQSSLEGSEPRPERCTGQARKDVRASTRKGVRARPERCAGLAAGGAVRC
jgi:hypothetical protein